MKQPKYSVGVDLHVAAHALSHYYPVNYSVTIPLRASARILVNSYQIAIGSHIDLGSYVFSFLVVMRYELDALVSIRSYSLPTYTAYYPDLDSAMSSHVYKRPGCPRQLPVGIVPVVNLS